VADSREAMTTKERCVVYITRLKLLGWSYVRPSNVRTYRGRCPICQKEFENATDCPHIIQDVLIVIAESE